MKERVTRIMFVLPSLIRAGAETQVVNLVNGLASEHFEKHLFTFEQQLDQLSRVDREHVRFHHCPRKHKFDVAPVVQLARLIDQQSIDVVHCSLQIALCMGWLAIRLATRKQQLMLALHTTVNRNARDEWFDKILYQWLMRSCHRILCVCKTQERYWQDKYPFLRGRTAVIYNGVDTDWFDPDKTIGTDVRVREQNGIPHDAFVVCCVAAFRPEKGHHYLLEAFKHFVKTHPNSYLLLVGNGPLREDIQLLREQIGLRENVLFLGSMNDVRPVLAASDISVLASTAVETFSMAMLESLAMGVPMVATNIGGTGEAVIDGVTGLLVNPGDVDQLSHALSTVTDHAQRSAMRRAARQLVITSFSEVRMLSETCAYIAGTVACKPVAKNECALLNILV